MIADTHAALLSALLALAVPAAFAVDRVSTIPVHFAKGESSATLRGSFAGYDTVRYTVWARAGQTMTVKIGGSRNANFHVLPVGAVPGATTAVGSGYVGGDWSGNLPDDGTYTVEVYQMRASARRGETVPYTLEIGVTGAAGNMHPGSAAGASAPATHAARGDYDASGQLPCARYAGQPTGACPFTVTRGERGAATVSVTHPDGLHREIFFAEGKAVGADLSQADGSAAVSSAKESDLFFVRVGSERYEIPEVVVVGD